MKPKRLGWLLLLALLPACVIIVENAPDIIAAAVTESNSSGFSSDRNKVLCANRGTQITVVFDHSGEVSRWSFRWTYANDGALRDYREFTASSQGVQPSSANRTVTHYTVPAPSAIAVRPSIVVEAPLVLEIRAYSPNGSSDTFTKAGYKETDCS
jgi:hypothetical protein